MDGCNEGNGNSHEDPAAMIQPKCCHVGSRQSVRMRCLEPNRVVILEWSYFLSISIYLT